MFSSTNVKTAKYNMNVHVHCSYADVIKWQKFAELQHMPQTRKSNDERLDRGFMSFGNDKVDLLLTVEC